jgi:acyl-CoA-binding protein
LYSSPVEKSEEVSEVFALYRQAQQSLEEGKDPGLAGELIERGVYFADELLMGSPGEMLAEGNRWSERKAL